MLINSINHVKINLPNRHSVLATFSLIVSEALLIFVVDDSVLRHVKQFPIVADEDGIVFFLQNFFVSSLFAHFNFMIINFKYILWH